VKSQRAGARSLKRAVELAPKNSSYLYNLATAQRMTGNLFGAEPELGSRHCAQPGNIRAYYTTCQTFEPRRLRPTTSMRWSAYFGNGFRNPQMRSRCAFAIAKELEDVSRYGMSFQYLKRGCDLQRRQITYTSPTTLQL